MPEHEQRRGAMSFQAFLNDPKSYLNVHRMMISQGMGANLVPGALTKAAAVANTAHGTSIQVHAHRQP